MLNQYVRKVVLHFHARRLLKQEEGEEDTEILGLREFSTERGGADAHCIV